MFLGFHFKFPKTVVLNNFVHFLDVGYADNRRIKGSIVGVPAKSAAQKIWLVFQALGDIAFAYPYSIILLEIQVLCNDIPQVLCVYCVQVIHNGFNS